VCDAAAREGIKTHFANAGVDLKNPDHVARVKRFFQAANENQMAVVLHARTRGQFLAEHARIMLDQILPAAPDVPIQIAHMGSSSRQPDETTAVFADAVVAKDPRVKNVHFDMTLPPGGNPPPNEHWKAVRKLPLTDGELRVLAANVPPYMK
jgi:predicted TIM-barrel fold metal-dependent hydrolase